MAQIVSKSKFKPRALHYFREVENTGEDLIISDRGKPVLRITLYRDDPDKALKGLRNTVLEYDDPLEPVGLGDWEGLK